MLSTTMTISNPERMINVRIFFLIIALILYIKLKGDTHSNRNIPTTFIMYFFSSNFSTPAFYSSYLYFYLSLIEIRFSVEKFTASKSFSLFFFNFVQYYFTLITWVQNLCFNWKKEQGDQDWRRQNSCNHLRCLEISLYFFHNLAAYYTSLQVSKVSCRVEQY